MGFKSKFCYWVCGNGGCWTSFFGHNSVNWKTQEKIIFEKNYDFALTASEKSIAVVRLIVSRLAIFLFAGSSVNLEKKSLASVSLLSDISAVCFTPSLYVAHMRFKRHFTDYQSSPGILFSSRSMALNAPNLIFLNGHLRIPSNSQYSGTTQSTILPFSLVCTILKGLY